MYFWRQLKQVYHGVGGEWMVRGWNFLARNRKIKVSHERHRRRWEYNSKTDFMEVGCMYADWIEWIVWGPATRSGVIDVYIPQNTNWMVASGVIEVCIPQNANWMAGSRVIDVYIPPNANWMERSRVIDVYIPRNAIWMIFSFWSTFSYGVVWVYGFGPGST